MDIVSFRTFLAAADIGSFAGAAKRVNASPSSVTERIKQLENRLGVQLFVRDKRGCRLTAAGRKFVAPAQKAVRAWEIARYDVSLPEEFTHSLAFGGQYALWAGFLTSWLADARAAFPHIAYRVTAGSSARLNNDLADGFLDIAVLYDPVFRKDLASDKLFDDRLLLVSAVESENWRDHYVRIEWGHSIGVEIASRLNLTPAAGLVLDLGNRSTHWLIEQKMCGFMPERIVRPYLLSGELRIVQDVPDFDYPAYICWRRDLDETLAENIISSLRSQPGLS